MTDCAVRIAEIYVSAAANSGSGCLCSFLRSQFAQRRTLLFRSIDFCVSIASFSRRQQHISGRRAAMIHRIPHQILKTKIDHFKFLFGLTHLNHEDFQASVGHKEPELVVERTNH